VNLSGKLGGIASGISRRICFGRRSSKKSSGYKRGEIVGKIEHTLNRKRGLTGGRKEKLALDHSPKG